MSEEGEKIMIGLLKEIKDKLSGSPLTSGVVDLKGALNLLGWPADGRRHLQWLRCTKLLLSRPEGAPTKYYVEEILRIKDKVRNKEIVLPKTYKRKV